MRSFIVRKFLGGPLWNFKVTEIVLKLHWNCMRVLYTKVRCSRMRWGAVGYSEIHNTELGYSKTVGSSGIQWAAVR